MPYVCYKCHGTHIVTPIWEFFLQIQFSGIIYLVVGGGGGYHILSDTGMHVDLLKLD